MGKKNREGKERKGTGGWKETRRGQVSTGTLLPSDQNAKKVNASNLLGLHTTQKDDRGGKD